MRWWPKPMRIVPTTSASLLSRSAVSGVAPSLTLVPCRDVTRRPGMCGEARSSSGNGTFEALRRPTLMT